MMILDLIAYCRCQFLPDRQCKENHSN